MDLRYLTGLPHVVLKKHHVGRVPAIVPESGGHVAGAPLPTVHVLC